MWICLYVCGNLSSACYSSGACPSPKATIGTAINIQPIEPSGWEQEGSIRSGVLCLRMKMEAQPATETPCFVKNYTKDKSSNKEDHFSKSCTPSSELLKAHQTSLAGYSVRQQTALSYAVSQITKEYRQWVWGSVKTCSKLKELNNNRRFGENGRHTSVGATWKTSKPGGKKIACY